MAKKRNKLVKKHKKNNFSFGSSYFLLFTVFIFILVLGFLKYNNFDYSKKYKLNKDTSKISAKSAELITYPSETPRPSETPVPLTGYCLKVPILMYHHIQPQSNAKQLKQTALSVDNEIFDSQMQYLSQNGYTSLFVNELINALINNQSLPEKSIVITMDDGYEDNFVYALPILKKYNLKANIMLSSGLMNNSNMLSWDEVNLLKATGLIYFTNHTWSHHSVIRGSQDKISMEIDVAKKQIEENTGQTVNIFTYPYREHNKTAENTLIEKGYVGAFTEIPGFYQCDSFRMTLHRTRIGNSSLSSYGL